MDEYRQRLSFGAAELPGRFDGNRYLEFTQETLSHLMKNINLGVRAEV